MFNFIPQLVILVALVVIIIIVARKLPKVADVEVEEKEKSASNKTSMGKSLKEEKGIVSLLRSFGLKFRDFCISIFKKIFIGAKKLKLEVKKKSEEEKELGKLVEEKINPSEVVDQEEIVDLLEQAAKYFGSGNYKEAEKTYFDIIKKDPRNLRAYKGLGNLYLKQGNLADAKASFEEVLKIKPGDSDARKGMEKIEIKKIEREG